MNKDRNIFMCEFLSILFHISVNKENKFDVCFLNIFSFVDPQLPYYIHSLRVIGYMVPTH